MLPTRGVQFLGCFTQSEIKALKPFDVKVRECVCGVCENMFLSLDGFVSLNEHLFQKDGRTLKFQYTCSDQWIVALCQISFLTSD